MYHVSRIPLYFFSLKYPSLTFIKFYLSCNCQNSLHSSLDNPFPSRSIVRFLLPLSIPFPCTLPSTPIHSVPLYASFYPSPSRSIVLFLLYIPFHCSFPSTPFHSVPLYFSFYPFPSRSIVFFLLPRSIPFHCTLPSTPFHPVPLYSSFYSFPSRSIVLFLLPLSIKRFMNFVVKFLKETNA